MSFTGEFTKLMNYVSFIKRLSPEQWDESVDVKLAYIANTLYKFPYCLKIIPQYPTYAKGLEIEKNRPGNILFVCSNSTRVKNQIHGFPILIVCQKGCSNIRFEFKNRHVHLELSDWYNFRVIYSKNVKARKIVAVQTTSSFDIPFLIVWQN